ncbi:hypothetical protein [Metabacillus bambusae]|uniref:DUF3906 domain-containing protein n=1 Tax=Metabacillus bambusae TaxID=2795218 RepID=A0ABS3N0D7_9BACI|nr:hypothetical protein [Metabacillus bambusae]MBO1511541.1 hypothetical protein [Metabacillus bambusae]
MGEGLYLVFETDYLFEGEVFTFVCDTMVPAEKNDNPTDEAILDEVKETQAPIFERNGLTVVDTRMIRLSELEYRRYTKKGLLPS